MQTVKLSTPIIGNEVAQAIRDSIANVIAGNALVSQGTAKTKSGKKYLADKLKALRDIDVAALPIGELITIQIDNEPAFTVDIGKQNRFDLATFEVEHAELAAKYKKDFATVSYKGAS